MATTDPLKPYVFNPNELWTLLIAAYAAVISTFVLGWDAYKWLVAGAKIHLTASPNMKTFGGAAPDPRTYVVIRAYNVGDQPTTITNLGGMYFDSWWRAYITKRKPAAAFVITAPSQAQPIPYRFEIGDQWMGMAEQTDELVQRATSGYLFFILYTAKGGHRVRVKVPEPRSSEK